MSLGVVRYKNGRPELVKASIWEAFRGAPSPRPRPQKPKPCPCCNKIHSEQQDPPTEPTPEKDTDGKKEELKTANKGDPPHSTRPQEIYSEEDNARIVEMKGANKTWKEILAAIEKASESQLKQHWKENLNPERTRTEQGSNKADKGTDTASKKPEKTQDKGKAGENANVKKSAEAQVPKKDKQNAAKPSEKKDDNELKAFVDRYDKRKWMAAASKHFDLTGQRISPAMARKLAEGKDA